MKQLLQDLSTGVLEVAEVPAPVSRAGDVLIHTSKTLISPGTERTLRDFGKANLVQKALQQPERVKDVLQKVRTDGLGTTLEAVRSKLEQPMPLGYCNVGRVIEAAGVVELKAGDRVVSNGPHAEIVRIPKNLVARVPDGVSDDAAAFTVLAAIALQGVRLADVQLGSSVVVTGLGLVGLLAVQLLRAQGARVLGIDLDASRCALARQFGAETVCISEGEDPLRRASAFSRGRGVDAVLICASTKSSEPAIQAAEMTRQQGHVILVGVTGLDLPRKPFFEKELVFRVSCSYGPGRYDPSYEEGGQDYPFGFVRWTAQRNFEAVLDMMADGKLDVAPLISSRFPITEAAAAYAEIDRRGDVLGVVLDYAGASEEVLRRTVPSGTVARAAAPGAVRVGMIGAGNYATRMLAPALTRAGADLKVICASGGVSTAHAARKFGFARATSETAAVIDADDVDLVVIATRHDSHAALAARALQNGKAVFVEKPLALSLEEVAAVSQAHAAATAPFLMVGFNRRFAPTTVALKKATVAAGAPSAIIMTVNAGMIPPSHWTQDRTAGGGRIIGEGCHFIDLARFLAGAAITRMEAMALGAQPGDANPEDRAIMLLGFANGTTATIHYLSNGHKSFPKERIDVFCAGRVWQIDNFRKLIGYGAPGLGGGLFAGQDKGLAGQIAAVLAALKTGRSSPIPFEELAEVAEVSIALDQRLRESR
jgi:predicted dehydrogenase